MNKILESLKSKKVRYGTFSTLMIVIVIAILIIINLVVDRLNLSYDMTANKLYSISQQSKDILANIDQDITIYALVRTGEENFMFANAVGQLTFKELLQEYANNSSHITVEYKDPYLYPQFAEKYNSEGEGALPVNTVIVENKSNNRFRAINPNEMITTDYNMQSFQQYVKTIDIEPRVTNAINYVTAENTPVIYTFTNHNEAGIPESLQDQMIMANFDVKTFDIVTKDIPEDCTILFLTQPARDWTESAVEKVREYLQNDGRALFAFNNIFTDMPNLNSLLDSFGVKIGNYLVIEGSAEHLVSSNPTIMLPIIADHELNKTLLERNYRPLFVQPSGVETLPVKKNSIKIEPLLTTSSSSYGKVNPEAQSIAKEEGDVDGPINVAVAVTDSYYTDVQHTTKLVVVAASSIVDEQINYQLNGSNYFFLINSLNWLQDKDDTVYIPSKSPSTLSQLTITQQQIYIMMFFSVFVVPLSVIAVGLVVWLRRRYS